ncbi:hypothetical protein AVEN_124325-1, partial [Araneus ventricosus]
WPDGRLRSQMVPGSNIDYTEDLLWAWCILNLTLKVKCLPTGVTQKPG